MVKEKTYLYIINMGEYEPTKRNYELQFGKELNVSKMKEAIKHFEGEHDFKNFVSDEAVKDNYVRNIYSTEIVEKDNKLYIRFTGNGFMKYQVRNMVGVLFKIGKGKLDLGIVNKIFEDSSNEKVISTMAREGLYLENIEY
jgi:tRNA pseudouridine38-40 synthase